MDSTWFHIDCTLGSNYWDKSNEFKKGYSFQYFAPDPSQLILTHYPKDKTMQLLRAPITSAELEPLVVHPLFAASRGIRPITWNRTITVDEQSHSTEVKFVANPSMKLGYKLVYMEDDAEKCKAIEKRNNLVLMQRDGNTVTVNVALPFRGSYTLLLTVNSEVKKLPPIMFLSYRIISSSNAKEEIGYPKAYEMAAIAYDFQLLYWNQCRCNSICESETEQLGVVFKAKRGISCTHFLIPGKTRNTIPSDESMVYNYNTMIVSSENTAAKGDKSSLCVYSLKVVFPYEGWWTICLNGSKSNPNYRTTQTQGYVTLMSYHVLARKGNSELSFPNFFTPLLSLSYFDPIPVVNQSIEIPFKATHPMKFDAHIVQKKPGAFEYGSYVQIEKLDAVPGYPQQYKLKARFPQPGKWYVRVFGRQEEKDEEESTATANHSLFYLLLDVKEPMEGAVTITVDSKEAAKAIQFRVDDDGFVTFPDNGEPLTVSFNCIKNTPFKHHILPVEPNNTLRQEEFEGLPILDHCTFINMYKVTFAQSMKARPKIRAVRANTTPLLPSQLCDLTSLHRLHASFPWPGKWIIEVFAKTSSTPESDFVAVFHIIVDVTKPTKGMYYPILYSEFDALGLNIPEENISYNPIYDSSEFSLSLHAPNDTHISWSITVNDSDVPSYATRGFVQEFITKNTNRHFRMTFSNPGVWKAVLYAAKDQPDGRKLTQDDFSPVIEFSLLVKHVDPDVAFPEIYPQFKKYRLSISPKDLPLITRVHNTTSSVVIPLHSPGNVNFAHRMESAEMSVEECRSMSDMYSSESGSGLHELAVGITKPGIYSITLWAQYIESESEDKEWELVLRHTIQCITQN